MNYRDEYDLWDSEVKKYWYIILGIGISLGILIFISYTWNLLHLTLLLIYTVVLLATTKSWEEKGWKSLIWITALLLSPYFLILYFKNIPIDPKILISVIYPPLAILGLKTSNNNRKISESLRHKVWKKWKEYQEQTHHQKEYQEQTHHQKNPSQQHYHKNYTQQPITLEGLYKTITEFKPEVETYRDTQGSLRTRLKEKENRTNLKLYYFLRKRGFNLISEKTLNRHRVDLYWPAEKLIIECKPDLGYTDTYTVNNVGWKLQQFKKEFPDHRVLEIFYMDAKKSHLDELKAELEITPIVLGQIR